MKREEKGQLISALNEDLKASEIVVVTLNKGLTVAKTTELRSLIRQGGASYRVVKNRLSRLAFKDTSFEGLSDLMKGPTGLAFSADPIAAAKAVAEFAKKNDGKFEILGGCLNGKVMSVEEVKALASLPSLDELRAKILGVINAPATKVACVLQAPASQVARVMGAYASKG